MDLFVLVNNECWFQQKKRVFVIENSGVIILFYLSNDPYSILSTLVSIIIILQQKYFFKYKT